MYVCHTWKVCFGRSLICLMLSDCIALISVLQIEVPSELQPLSCHSTEDPSVSLPVSSLRSSRRFALDCARLMERVADSLSRTLSETGSFLREISCGSMYQNLRDSTTASSAVWEKATRRDATTRYVSYARQGAGGGGGGLTARQTAVSNQNRRVGNCHPRRVVG